MKLSELTDQETTLGALKKQHFENWLPEWDDFRTFRVEILDTLNIGTKIFTGCIGGNAIRHNNI